MQDRLAPLYPQHLATLRQRADKALVLGGFDHLVIAAGSPLRKFLDDQDYPFVANPHFRHWLPLTDTPGSWIVYTPGKKPKLIYLQPKDYWHVVPAAPSGYWVEHFDIEIVRNATDAVALLPGEHTRRAILGPECPEVPGAEANNPQAVLDYLHWHRSYKTPYELELMREASRIGTRAHRAAEHAFRTGESEFGIHMAYLAAAGQIDAELPYASIVGLNEHGAVLHYTHFDRRAPAESRSFLIDAGASAAGYASDITRTYAAKGHDEFQALIDSVDVAQRDFVAKVRAGQSYPELHIHAHHVLADVLREHGIIRMSAESAVASGVTAAFFPHGLGHPIGLQVHDVSGFQASETGGAIARPQGHPYLRMTRVLEAGMVVTIEPGLYFIDMLLDELRAKPVSADIDWSRVAQFRPYGGIRIEDDVVCTDGAPENLTRDAFALIG
ncbi:MULTISPECIES: Xaa-Pro dipeptidase [unclassified Dyella]|uniref:Xaa-Pro dipeptidase n=1 Tax=unclassified Dyella TaxID=2634549 RepID=UPI000C83ACF3|nr:MULTISPECIES: Xaa-Pro dipeptidase [unclassified Dyella]MDR3447283.1 Xaa-Pro dipeptidase [Dyella sp.]PMQ02986.1 Xaa-Pro dipeptidase [Dyella sp. AD56]